MDREVYAPIVSEETMRKLIKKLDDVSLRSQIVDNLTTASDTKALSANMGKKLQDEKLSIANLASTLGQQTNTAPTNKAVDDAISSLNGAINAIISSSVYRDLSSYTGKTLIENLVSSGIKFYYCSSTGGSKLSDLPIIQAGNYFCFSSLTYPMIVFIGINGVIKVYSYDGNTWA